MRSIFNFLCLLLLLFISNSSNAQTKKYYKIYQKLSKASRDNDTSKNNYFLDIANKKNKKDWNDYTLKYTIYFQLKKYDLALLNISKAIEERPSIYTQYMNKANCYRLLYDYDNAFKQINIALAMDSLSVPVAYNARGNLYFETGKYKEALADYTKSIQLSHNYYDDIFLPSAKIYKSKCNYFLGNFDEAINDLDFNENDSSYYGKYATFEKGKIYFTQNKLELANASFHAFIGKSRNSFDIALANAYLGDKEKALCVITKFNPKKINSSDYLHFTQIYSVLHDTENAFKYLELLLQTNYQRYAYLYTDYDLVNIRSLPKFTELMQKYQTNKPN